MVEEKFMSKSPSERLRIIYDDLKIIGFFELKQYLVEKLQCKESDLTKFSHKTFLDGNFYGYIYHCRNNLYGSLFGFYNDIPFVVRGMPKIDYIERKIRTELNNCWLEEKIDGTNLVLFNLPDGTFWGKTRETATMFNKGFKDREWYKLLEETDYIDELKQLCSVGYAVIVELYGYKNKCEFINYTVPIAIKVLEIYDMNTFKFLNRRDKEMICRQHNLPYAESLVIDETLTLNKVKMFEKIAEGYVKTDGLEGFVAKYVGEDGDVYMGKIKCQSVREKCYKNTIRMNIIRKAVRKAIEAEINLNNIDEAIKFVKDELLEDYSEKIVEANMQKIKYGIEHPEEKKQEFKEFSSEMFNEVFNKIKEQGIEISMNNKTKVLSLASSYIDESEKRYLFNAFLTYIKNNGQ